MINNRCLRLETDYSYFLESQSTSQSRDGMSYMSASETCDILHGHVAHLDPVLFDKLKHFLNIWRHNPEMGDIWVYPMEPVGDQACSVIRVSFLSL